MERIKGYAGLHDYNRAIRDIASSPDWQSGDLARQLDRVIQVAARYMGVGRVGVWLLGAENRLLDCHCQFDERTGLTRPSLSLHCERYPAYFEALTQSRVLAVDDALNDRVTAELVEAYLQPHRIVSLLDAPIWLNGQWIGVICHEHSGEPRAWRDEDVAFAGSMSDFAAMAFSQRRYQQVESVRDRLARIIEMTPDIVATMTLDGYLIEMNSAGRQLLGLAEDVDVTRFRGRDFMGRDTRYLLETEILPALHRSGRWVGEAMLRENTTRALPVSVVALAHRDPQGALEYYSVTLRDLSAQKKIQAEIRRLNEGLEARVAMRTRELEYANRNLEAFAYSVSHDLKAPLRGIAGYGRLLAEDYGAQLPDEARDYLASILDASRRMDRMIEDILAYSRAQIRELKPGPVDVVEVVRRVVGEFDAQWRDGVERVDAVEPAVLECDREGLSQILRNFVANAIRFSRDRHPPRIRIEGRTTPGGYRFSVSDNGIGFDMRYHDRVFEIFQRLPNNDESDGSGIGLALAARAAERMNGRVWADSVPGQGATFYFELTGRASV